MAEVACACTGKQEVAKLMGGTSGDAEAEGSGGEIPGIKLGKLWRFRASALDSYVQETMTRQG